MRTIATLATILLLLGCAEDNPFKADPEVQWEGGESHPHIEGIGTESGGMGSFLLSDLDPDVPGIQDAVMIEFDKTMDPSTIVSGAFQMEETFPGSGPVDLQDVQYYPEIRRAVLTATFSDDTGYLLTIPAGSVLDIAGMQMDPNRNAVYDGPPWDDVRGAFAAGAGQLPDISTPIIDNKVPNNGGKTDFLPDIWVSFIDGPMDVSDLTLNNFTLVRTSDSSEVPLQLLNASATMIIARPQDSLEYGTRYTVRLSAQLADSSGNSLDTNGDGYVWPDEPDLVWDFQMIDDSTTTSTPPTLGDATLMPGGLSVRIEFQESLTGDQVDMDETTFTASNIQLMDGEGSIPLDFETGADPSAVECLLQRQPAGPVTLYISCNVADEYGNLFDGDNNGLGGNPEEDDWWGVL